MVGQEIYVNDAPVPLSSSMTVQTLLEHLGHHDARGLAVAVNDAVHPRSQWARQQLHAGDRITLIRAAAGG
ncbi:MAG: sulfur carrier protein ThiS [Planctomycetota bacterium]|nr:MAG: sulfur carrier protein ThiS [Planctomycetota bacterium]